MNAHGGVQKNGKVCFLPSWGRGFEGEIVKDQTFHFFLHLYYNEYSFNSDLAYDLLARGGSGQEVAGAVLSKSRHQGHLIPLHIATSNFELYFFKLVGP